MKALIIGATGLIGKELVKQLINRKEFTEVVVFVRRKTEIKHIKLTEHVVNFNQPDSWTDKIKGDVLFSCLGTTLKKAGTQARQYQVDYTFQLNTAEAAARNKVAHYVLISSSGAKANSLIFYRRVKGQLEDAILQLPFEQITILRPSLLLGTRNEKRAGEAIAQKIMSAVTRFIFRRYRPITAATVAHAMINAVFQPEEKIIYESAEIFPLAELP